LLILAAVIATLVSDLQKRRNDGIPDPQQTGITTFASHGTVKIGAASVDITPFLKADIPPALPALAEEPFINPLYELITLSRKELKFKKRKIVNKLFVKAIVFTDNKTTAAIISTDIPSLSPNHLKAVSEQLANDFNIQERFTLVFSPATLNCFTISPADLAQCASECIQTALNSVQRASFASIAPVPVTPSANYNRINIEDIGGVDVPPLCGTQINNKTYDATNHASRWLSTFTYQIPLSKPFSIKTAPFTTPALSIIVFRTRKDIILGGIILSPYTPSITPPAKLGGDISSDYTYYLCSFFEKKLGGHFLFIRSPGTDIMPYIDNFSHPNSHRFGTKIATNAISFIEEATWQKLKKIRFYNKPVELPLKPWAKHAREELKALADRYISQARSLMPVPVDLLVKRQTQDKCLTAFYLNKYYDKIQHAKSAIKAARFNDVILIGLPGETFFQTGHKIKSNYNQLNICIADNLDHDISYIVPEDKFNGGYKPNRSMFTAQAENQLVRETHHLIDHIRRKRQ
jgi:hypothetical protein